jgi:tRNA-uridine 2-sulfurtransferase
MNFHSDRICALGLCSGGLDSILSALVLRNQGIDVKWITFETPFFSSEKAMKAAKMTNIPITVKNITEPYLEMVRNPRAGYGKNMNPCMDCHAMMFRLAGEMIRKERGDFLFSGEVVGQRPMSQTKPSLRYVEKHSGFQGLILRPLSAKNLPETIPEQMGLVDRNSLLDFSGRSRKPQMELAKKFGITQYPSPAGGCLLTDKGYSTRLKDLFDHQEHYSEDELHLLRYGRHLRLDNQTKLIVGRTKVDNDSISRHLSPTTDITLRVEKIPGPLAVIPGGSRKEMIVLAASICAGYSKAGKNISVGVRVTSQKETEIIQVIGTPPSDIPHLLI